MDLAEQEIRDLAEQEIRKRFNQATKADTQVDKNSVIDYILSSPAVHLSGKSGSIKIKIGQCTSFSLGYKKALNEARIHQKAVEEGEAIAGN